MSGFDVTKTFNRFTQRAGELVNKNEKTSYPTRTSDLIHEIDQMKAWISKIITATEEFVDINIASKVVDAFQKNKEKITTTDKLGTALEQVASQSEKATPQLSKMLTEAADVHQRMATARKSFNSEVNTTFIEDLKNFLNTTLSEAQKAKTKLEEVRLDLDSDKTKLKNAKTAEQKAKWEAEVRKDESDFDRVHQESLTIFEKTCKEFDGLSVQLLDLIRAEKNYYEACAKECSMMLGE
uniref:p29 n=1 Tax=Echinococcus canadensis TaxID=519352 RepID=A0A023IUN6_9CEST|nr:P29 [Echinococcus canadensis]